jgi:hypothetical protein
MCDGRARLFPPHAAVIRLSPRSLRQLPALVRRDPAVPARQWLRRRWASLLLLFASV